MDVWKSLTVRETFQCWGLSGEKTRELGSKGRQEGEGGERRLRACMRGRTQALSVKLREARVGKGGGRLEQGALILSK